MWLPWEAGAQITNFYVVALRGRGPDHRIVCGCPGRQVLRFQTFMWWPLEVGTQITDFYVVARGAWAQITDFIWRPWEAGTQITDFYLVTLGIMWLPWETGTQITDFYVVAWEAGTQITDFYVVTSGGRDSNHRLLFGCPGRQGPKSRTSMG